MLLLVLAMADTVSGAALSGTQAMQSAVTTAPVAPAAPAAPVAAVPAATTDGAATSSAATTATPAIGPGAGDPPAAAAPSAAPVASNDASASAAQTAYITEPRDPWVKINRSIFSFDIALERGLLGPAAHGYVHVVPRVVRFHVTSALYNLGEPLTVTNDLLQLRIGSMGKAIYRFVINSTLGIAGLFDVAKAGGVPIHISDFGQTLGRYGVRMGPYVMLPLLGPSNVRDGLGRLVDTFLDPMQFLIGGVRTPVGASLFVFEGVDWRSRSDDTMMAVYGATDPYAFTRSAYTQARAAQVLQATGKQAVLPDFDAVPGTP